MDWSWILTTQSHAWFFWNPDQLSSIDHRPLNRPFSYFASVSSWVISHVPMFHITQPWSVYGLFHGYFFRWCPIFPSHGTVTKPCSSLFYMQSDRPGGFFVPADGPLDGHEKTASEHTSWNDWCGPRGIKKYNRWFLPPQLGLWGAQKKQTLKSRGHKNYWLVIWNMAGLWLSIQLGIS